MVPLLSGFVVFLTPQPSMLSSVSILFLAGRPGYHVTFSCQRLPERGTHVARFGIVIMCIIEAYWNWSFGGVIGLKGNT